MGFKGRHPSFHSASMPFIKNEVASDIGLDYFLSPLPDKHGRGFHRRKILVPLNWWKRNSISVFVGYAAL